MVFALSSDNMWPSATDFDVDMSSWTCHTHLFVSETFGSGSLPSVFFFLNIIPLNTLGLDCGLYVHVFICAPTADMLLGRHSN